MMCGINAVGAQGMCGINAVGAQGSGCTFTLCHTPLKMAVLLHKTEKVWDSFSETVSLNFTIKENIFG